ncbi:YsnF/AvaK domain-containing protein [Granulicella sibirica]|nr:YsnF/AvaK domain-containing protein [Granulicella sibirica]
MTDTESATSTVDDQSTTRPNVLAVSGQFDATQPFTEIWMANGEVVRLPTSVLLQTSDVWKSADTRADVLSSNNSVTIPLVEERLEVGKRTVATGTVRLNKTVQEYTEALDETLAVRTFDVERIVINQPVDAPPPVRQEGNTTIYSLVEERLVLTKELVLKEEIRIIQRDTERHDTQVVTLHKEHISVERVPG